MASIKLTTWNIEHLGKLLPNPPQARIPKLKGIVDEIKDIDPDILCIVEGPGNLLDLQTWVQSNDGMENKYHVATIIGTDDILAQNPANPRQALQSLYNMQGNDSSGNQWVWFLVRDGLFQSSNAHILNPDIWQGITRQKSWKVHEWGKFVKKNHKHWRHPQTLLINLNGVEIEIIGVHLKSKINKKKAFDTNGNLTEKYIKEALMARIKLATEAYDIRRYIDRRFEQTPNPRIFVCGDMNDGPGRGYFEREFLYFDLVSNVQGEVFFAKRFLNHALFDFDEQLRWSTAFDDKIEEWSRQQRGAESLPSTPIDPSKNQLIDHILFTQALSGSNASPRVKQNAGKVEHTIHNRTNALLTSSNKTSDHVPVSVELTI